MILASLFLAPHINVLPTKTDDESAMQDIFSKPPKASNKYMNVCICHIILLMTELELAWEARISYSKPSNLWQPDARESVLV